MIIHPALRNVNLTPDGYNATFANLRLVATEFIEADGKKWRHASVSRRGGGMPSFDDLKTLKKYCIGEEKTALQIFPPAEQYFAGYKGTEVLHLWACLDGNVVPDFRKWNPATGRMEI